MSAINDGGPAFPVQESIMSGGNPVPAATGMTLRDYFAAQALAGWLASYGPDDSVKIPQVANFAYELADAMIAAREGNAK